MATAVQTPDEFAATMQQLSAEAARLLPGKGNVGDPRNFQPSHESVALNKRLNEIEQSLARKIELIAARAPSSDNADLATRFAKIDEQLTAIRNTDQMNQRLVDSLHQELVEYRDNFLHESLQKPFIHDLVHLFDDLTSLAEQLRTAADQKTARTRIEQWRENLENAIHSLLEVLHRLEVREIESKEMVDRSVHKVISFEPSEFAEDDGRIVMRLKRGFVWRGKVIRAEEVIAKKCQ
jgi:molecular chaperone GrpE (heat shock protein)